ncbi:MAG: hypothetical protein IGS50_04320 [Synechococcales cyanobacterium C42_A2020_086]|jgi:hypothetical protein|nr:hypothetical protein [Synechococcales cyanobacterium C42_A2020_086]
MNVGIDQLHGGINSKGQFGRDDLFYIKFFDLCFATLNNLLLWKAEGWQAASSEAASKVKLSAQANRALT